MDEKCRGHAGPGIFWLRKKIGLYGGLGLRGEETCGIMKLYLYLCRGGGIRANRTGSTGHMIEGGMR